MLLLLLGCSHFAVQPHESAFAAISYRPSEPVSFGDTYEIVDFNRHGIWPCGFWSGQYTFLQEPSWLDANAKYTNHFKVSTSGGDPTTPATWIVVSNKVHVVPQKLPGKRGCMMWVQTDIVLRLGDQDLLNRGILQWIYNKQGMQVNIQPNADMVGTKVYAQLVRHDPSTNSYYSSQVYSFMIAAK